MIQKINEESETIKKYVNDLILKKEETINNSMIQKINEESETIKKYINDLILKKEETINNSIDKYNKKITKENSDRLNEIKEEYNNLKNELNKNNIEQQNKIKELQNNINNYNDAYKFNIDLFNNYKNKICSEIIKYDELILIENRIQFKLSKKIKKCELLFRASKDGFQSLNFHDKCNGKNNTVTFVITTTGRRFGGFTDQTWDSTSGYKSGSNGFIFSLDKKEIYYNKNNRYNIYCNSSYGPTFGCGFDFCLSNNCNTNNYSYEIVNYFVICSTYVSKCLELINEDLLCITQQNSIFVR
jgi:hypothetical protein